MARSHEHIPHSSDSISLIEMSKYGGSPVSNRRVSLPLFRVGQGWGDPIVVRSNEWSFASSFCLIFDNRKTMINWEIIRHSSSLDSPNTLS